MAVLIVLIIFILAAVVAYVALVLLVDARDRRTLAEFQRQDRERRAEWERVNGELADWEYAALYERYGDHLYPNLLQRFSGDSVGVSTMSAYPEIPRFRAPVRILAPPPLDVPGAD